MTELEIAQGRLVGLEIDGVHRFGGIPFAQAPVGELRFAPPREHPGWSGVRDASGFGPISPQEPGMVEMILGVAPEAWDEDCLHLNVWTPAGAAGGAGLPVMVWIHGGGFTFGSGSQELYRAERFVAGRDVVVVSLNYRLGVFGFCELGHLDPSLAGSGNNGLRDQVAALRWVRDNIAAFGGDPNRVTVFGESAGAMSVSLLMASGLSENLFQRAIVQSGAANGVHSVEESRRHADALCSRLGVTTVEELRATDPGILLRAQGQALMESMSAETMMESGSAMAGMPWMPVADGDLVPFDPFGALAAGAAAGVDLMAGTTSDEWTLFGLMDNGVMDDAELRRRAAALSPDGEKVVGVYASTRPGLDAKGHFDAMMTDIVFRMPVLAQVEAQAAHGAVFNFEFAERVDAFGGSLGAPHSIELPFLFDRCDLGSFPMLIGAEPSRRLIEGMADAWVAFAATGDPSTPKLGDWPVYRPDGRPTMVLTSEPRVVEDLRPDERRLWESLRP